jgi:hypothetical protein
MERENIVPGPFSHGDPQTKQMSQATHKSQATDKSQDSSSGMADRPQQAIQKGIMIK